MATEALKSLAITNRDATPKVLNSAFLEAGLLRECVGYVSAGASDTSSLFRMCEVPSNARISQILLFSEDVGNAGAINVGVHRTIADGGAVVYADFFATAVDVNTAALNAVDITHESGASVNHGLAQAEKMLWQALGLTADPNVMYDVTITPSTGFQTGGKIVLKVRYTK